MPKNILITGGSGFIGTHLVKHLCDLYPVYNIINLDNLSYASNPAMRTFRADNYRFIEGDIRDASLLDRIFEEYSFDTVINVAAESHVDRSISGPFIFAETNVTGTLKLLESARRSWNGNLSGKLFYQISTDEVYGSLLMEDPPFRETSCYEPRSPYSASKAAADHFVNSYWHTYGMPVIISHSSNNYGPYQFPEKLIPLFINNIIERKNLPVYGNGQNVRDWIYVGDHVSAIDIILHNGQAGQVYNIGGGNEVSNLDLTHKLIKITDRLMGNTEGFSSGLVQFVGDRPGHDLRYAIDTGKITAELGWRPAVTFAEGLEKTVRWYLDNQQWLRDTTSGSYKDYYKKQYSNR